MTDTPQKGESWEEDFVEEFCKGGELLAPNMRGAYVMAFIRSLLRSEREKLVREMEDRLAKVPPQQMPEEGNRLNQGFNLARALHIKDLSDVLAILNS